MAVDDVDNNDGEFVPMRVKAWWVVDPAAAGTRKADMSVRDMEVRRRNVAVEYIMVGMNVIFYVSFIVLDGTVQLKLLYWT